MNVRRRYDASKVLKISVGSVCELKWVFAAVETGDLANRLAFPLRVSKFKLRSVDKLYPPGHQFPALLGLLFPRECVGHLAVDLIMELLTKLHHMRSAPLQLVIPAQPDMVNRFFYGHPLILLLQELANEVPAEGAVGVPDWGIELDLTSSDALDGC